MRRRPLGSRSQNIRIPCDHDHLSHFEERRDAKAAVGPECAPPRVEGTVVQLRFLGVHHLDAAERSKIPATAGLWSVTRDSLLPAMSSAVGPGPPLQTRSPALEESIMTATYTFDVFASLDGFGSYEGGDWGGYWGKQGPEFLDRRLAVYSAEQRMVLGANTYRLFAEIFGSVTEESEADDPVNSRMRHLPTTVVSTTLEGPLDYPDATLESGDAVDVVARLKQESDVPLRSHGSVSMNRALMAAGLVDRVQLTIFPVITGQTGVEPVFQNAPDLDLELIESRTLDAHIQELIYRPTLHT